MSEGDTPVSETPLQWAELVGAINRIESVLTLFREQRPHDCIGVLGALMADIKREVSRANKALGRHDPQSSIPPSTAQEIADMKRTPGEVIDVPALDEPERIPGLWLSVTNEDGRIWLGIEGHNYGGEKIGASADGATFADALREMARIVESVSADHPNLEAGIATEDAMSAWWLSLKPSHEAVPGVQEPERVWQCCRCGSFNPPNTLTCVCGLPHADSDDEWSRLRSSHKPEPLPGLAEQVKQWIAEDAGTSPEPPPAVERTQIGRELPGLAEVLTQDAVLAIANESGMYGDRLHQNLLALLTPWLTSREASSAARIARITEQRDGWLRSSGEWAEAARIDRTRAEQAEAALTELAEKAQAVLMFNDGHESPCELDVTIGEDDIGVVNGCSCGLIAAHAALRAALPKESR